MTLDDVTVGDQTFTNVVVRIDQFSVKSVGGSGSIISGVSANCVSGNFTIEKFNAIQIGMSLDQVNQTIGCSFDSNNIVRASGLATYRWQITDPDLKFIQVSFNATDLTVTDRLGRFIQIIFWFLILLIN